MQCINRRNKLQDFVDAAKVAYEDLVTDSDGLRASRDIFKALESPRGQGTMERQRLPVCDNLSAVVNVKTSNKALDDLKISFKAIEPALHWRRRESYDSTASPNFVDGHANVMILGPGGLEERSDVQVGFSLLAPHVRYPGHRHPPEEVYLVLSEGEFRHGTSDWFSPGVGGTLYNSPGIEHAMRSGSTPLFAMWILQAH
jgi:hypothetical protein